MIKNIESADNFCDNFSALFGYRPLSWQRRLFRKHFLDGDLPSAIDLPTGLGKTSVMAVWYLALKSGARIPRRLIYVVDRRAVVDQATTIAEEIKEKSDDSALRVSTLRGQYVDNREWQDDPTAPAIVVGTIDMIGSRLLFSGYGVSRKMRPYHAGLLGTDALVVLDEAHLVPPFEMLLEAIESGITEFGSHRDDGRNIVPRCRLLSLSATGRTRTGNIFRLCDADRADSVVEKRLIAPKRVKLEEPLTASEAAEAMADRAWKYGAGGRRVIVFCNSRKTAQAVHGDLKNRLRTNFKKTDAKYVSEPTDMIELIVGARRVYEREALAKSTIFKRFSSNTAACESVEESSLPGFLVCTSAGEVGVDLDADHMVCDLVPWERMVQRLGRVNRQGEFLEGSRIDVFPIMSDKDKEAEIAVDAQRMERWRVPFISQQWPAGDDGRRDASPGALRYLREDETFRKLAEAATTPVPLRPALTRALVDAWSMTSLDKHTGRPEVAPWLRGWVEDDEPKTSVTWRTYLPVRAGSEASKKEIEDFFEAAPPHASEKLETETWRVADWLMARAAALLKAEPSAVDQDDAEKASRASGPAAKPPQPHDIVAFALSSAGDCRARYRLNELAGDTKSFNKKLNDDLANAMLVVDARLGGLTSGLLKEDSNAIPPTTDNGGTWLSVLADDMPVVGFRVHPLARPEAAAAAMRHAYAFATRRNDEGEDIELLLVETSATEESRAASANPQSLAKHHSWTEARALAIAAGVGLTGDYRQALAIAARLHDEGKKSVRWQRAFSAPRDGEIYAKTKGPINFALLDGYRHEFGSLPFAEKDAAFQTLPADLQDLVLHLIAAHHGRARPSIETTGCEDAPPSVLEVRARDVALRFARLQKQWGPWGLAWWEALLRAADQQASRANDKGGKSDGDG